jgi:predicted aspartyl protease
MNYKQQYLISSLNDNGPIVQADVFTNEESFLKLKNFNKYERYVKAPLLIDTGSSISGLDKKIIEQLQLPQYRETVTVDGAGGMVELNLFKCILYLPIFEKKGLPIDIIEGDYSQSPYSGIIGRDVLQFCTFEYNGPEAKYVLKAIDF